MDHDLRQSLNDELHGRTGLAITAPTRITHLAFTIDEGDAAPWEHLVALTALLGLPPPQEAALHLHMKIPGGLVRFERHGEFYRLAVIAEGKQPSGSEAIDLLPPAWVEGLPGQRLVAIHTHLISARTKSPDDAELMRLFGHDDLAAASVAHGDAQIWTDFRIGPDSFSRWLVQDKGLPPLRLGRVIRRIHEIETYRMMALLALPLARAAQKELRPLEQELHDVIASMTEEKSAEHDATLLARLSVVARKVEELSNRTNYRFAATRAYAALVEKRVTELNETKLRNYQRIGVFLDRRFSPAVATCNAVTARIEGLAQRSERANNLLRTRVDIALEGQNQALLRSMDRRARQQLLLQETVEGLSVVAISYYLISILQKMFEAAGGEWVAAHEGLIKLIGIPVLMLGVWLAIRSLRKRAGS
ncbi:DUF3422 family protein [Aestuariivirga litoralis]|uniref:DUF3422 family protein n=1 Tax=Aestuariivirga litoralis TaxID=2650924 RepID=UPI0018C6B82C|nr:DUF3422 domain-containing protein [Aestuariivirga litoralis]MBG1233242.1 DUF3422 domain-containing protein [Aestuariivirga litoralis]